MLQSARSAESKSFLREIEDALVLIKDEKAKEYFLKQMREVFTKRNDPNTLFTGERNLKAEFLAYLKQKGFVQTANIWARNIIVEQEAIDNLLRLLHIFGLGIFRSFFGLFSHIAHLFLCEFF